MPLPVLNAWRVALLGKTATLNRTRSAVTINKILRALNAVLNADGASGSVQDLEPVDERDTPQEERPSSTPQACGS